MSVLELSGCIRLGCKAGEKRLEYSAFLGRRPRYRRGFRWFGRWRHGALWAGWLIASWTLATSPLPLPRSDQLEPD